jgi:hypothetical protein
MSVKSAPGYWLVCDECGHESIEETESVGTDPSGARDLAADCDWCEHDGRDLCSECAIALRCDECGELDCTEHTMGAIP